MIRTEVTASVGVISANVRAITPVSDLLLQAVVVAGDKRTEGRLIEAVATPWFDIIELLKCDPSIAFQIPACRWEEIIAGSYRKQVSTR
ncbi:MAG: hypothetical protein M0002_02340 [Rhodospirillales bacterium]|nr:hypothetical protein [Rhodospirillales bacterium]